MLVSELSYCSSNKNICRYFQKRPTPKAKAESKKEQAEKENEQIESYGNLPLGGPAALAGLIGIFFLTSAEVKSPDGFRKGNFLVEKVTGSRSLGCSSSHQEVGRCRTRGEP